MILEHFLFSIKNDANVIDFNDIKIIETKAFCDCSKLHTVILSTKKNIIIKADVFRGCAALRTIAFGSGVVEVYNQNFSDSPNVSFVCKPGTNAKKHGIRVINI